MIENLYKRYNLSIILLFVIVLIMAVFAIYGHLFTVRYNMNCSKEGITIPVDGSYDEFMYGFVVMLFPALFARRTLVILMLVIAAMYLLASLIPLINPYNPAMGCYTMGGDNDDQTATIAAYFISYLSMSVLFYIITIGDVFTRATVNTLKFIQKLQSK